MHDGKLTVHFEIWRVFVCFILIRLIKGNNMEFGGESWMAHKYSPYVHDTLVTSFRKLLCGEKGGSLCWSAREVFEWLLWGCNTALVSHLHCPGTYVDFGGLVDIFIECLVQFMWRDNVSGLIWGYTFVCSTHESWRDGTWRQKQYL